MSDNHKSNNSKAYTTAQVAELLGVSESRVREIAKSKGVGSKLSHVLVFTENDVKKMRIRKRLMPGQTRVRQAEITS